MEAKRLLAIVIFWISQSHFEYAEPGTGERVADQNISMLEELAGK